MGSRKRNLFVLLFVLGLVAVSALVIVSKSTRLGLDLKGGLELVYQGRGTPSNPEVTGDTIDKAITKIRERIDTLGVAEPEVSRLGATEITVSLPDITDAKRAIDQVGTTAQLYFYDWEPNVITQPKIPKAKPGGSSETPFDSAYKAVSVASQQPQSCDGCTTTGPRYYLFSKGKEPKLLAGPVSAKKDLYESPTGKKFSKSAGQVLTVQQGTLVLTDTQKSDPACLTSECYWVLNDRPALSGSEIKDPAQGYDQVTNQPNITFSFTDKGRQEFQDVTRAIAQRGQNKAIGPVNSAQASALSGHFAAVLDNEVVSRPIINFAENPDGIDGRTGAQISGSFTPQEAQDVASALQIGALPITLQLISQTQVSATLGQQALDQGILAGAIGLILVMLFLVGFYRVLGVIASSALIAYGLIFFALIKLIPITLTLPGIAGLILTIGVAADSNIVIFERIKEEVRAGRSISSAITIGYRRGIATIIDANVVTLLTAFILFVLATAGVKGFAFTLGVGIMVSLLTAVVFTQALLGSMSHTKFMRSPAMLGAKPQERVRWHFDFMGASKWFFSISGMILIIGAFALTTKQLNFGIDFESGTRIKVALSQTTDENGVRGTLNSIGIKDESIQRASDPNLGDNVFQIETSELTPKQGDEIQSALDNKYGIDQGAFDNTTIGPTFGAQVADSAVLAIIFSLLLISGYIAIRFQPKFAIPVLIAIVHDILITGGIYALTGREVTTSTVAAILTILGYSLYDTIIVFDRIRENLPRMPRAAFSQIVNRSMSEVMTRSLVTSFCTLISVVALMIFGGTTLQDFAFAIMIGIISGTYSSIFIASPVLTAWKEREPAYRRRGARLIAAYGEVPPFAEDVEVAKLGDTEPTDAELELEGEQATQARAARVDAAPAIENGPDDPGPDSPGAGDAEVEGGGDASKAAKTSSRPETGRRPHRRRKHGRSR